MDPEVRERFERMEGVVSGMLETVSGLLTLAAEHQRAIDKLRQAQEKTDEQLRQNEESIGVLVKMMDEWIRDRRNGQGS